jgi:hypothetical protein
VWIDSEGIPSEETHRPAQSLPHAEEGEGEEEIERIGLLESTPVCATIEDPISTDQPAPVLSEDYHPSHTDPSSSSSPSSPLEKTPLSSVASVQELLDLYIFPSLLISERKSHLDLSTLLDLCRNCFSAKEGRELFLQSLDDRRGRNSELTIEQYERMKIAMKVPPASPFSPSLDR